MDNFWKKYWGNHVFWSALLLAFSLFAYAFQPIRMFEEPYKVGEVTLFSMLILCLIGYFYGPLEGFITCFLFGAITFTADVLLGYSPFRLTECMDYLIGYTLMGFCGVLAIIPKRNKQKRSLISCFTLAIFLRFLESVCIWSIFREEPVSWHNDLWYGFINCIGYIGIEYVISIILLLLPPVKKAITFIQKATTEKFTEDYDFF